MEYEYTIKTYSMQQLSEKGIVVDPEKNIVYACRPDGACEIRDVGAEQIVHLASRVQRDGQRRMGTCPALVQTLRDGQFLEEKC